MTEGSIDPSCRPGNYTPSSAARSPRSSNVKVGGTVVLIAPEGTATPTGVVPRMRRFRVVGIFESGMYEIDRGLALIEMSDAARLFRTRRRRHGLAPGAAAIRSGRPRRGARGAQAPRAADFYVKDWTQDHENFFRSIDIMKSMMFMILLMIVGVAAFNIVATLVMIVKEKQTDIAILRTLGAGAAQHAAHLRRPGRAHRAGRHRAGGGSRHSCCRTTCETLVGALERLLGTQFLDARVYYMSDLPAYVERTDVLQMCARGLRLVRPGDDLPGVARRPHRARGGPAA